MKKLFVFSLFLASPAMADVNRACQSGEKWSEIPVAKFWAERFNQYATERVTPVEGMAFAQKLRKESETRFEEFFSEYWLSASLFKSGHFPLAEAGFEKILTRLPDEK